jgi:hypothetical protein
VLRALRARSNAAVRLPERRSVRRARRGRGRREGAGRSGGARTACCGGLGGSLVRVGEVRGIGGGVAGSRSRVIVRRSSG